MIGCSTRRLRRRKSRNWMVFVKKSRLSNRRSFLFMTKTADAMSGQRPLLKGPCGEQLGLQCQVLQGQGQAVRQTLQHVVLARQVLDPRRQAHEHRGHLSHPANHEKYLLRAKAEKHPLHRPQRSLLLPNHLPDRPQVLRLHQRLHQAVCRTLLAMRDRAVVAGGQQYHQQVPLPKPALMLHPNTLLQLAVQTPYQPQRLPPH